MPFQGEPTNEELTYTTERLAVRPIAFDDANEAHALLTHQHLDFIDPTFVPSSAGAYAEFANQSQNRTENDEEIRRYHWALRIDGSGEMVGLISAQLRRSDRLRSKALPVEVRELETTAYVHPDHQHLGYASEADAAISTFIEPRFQGNRRVAQIRHDNTVVQAKAEEAGAKKLTGQTERGYETWVLYGHVED